MEPPPLLPRLLVLLLSVSWPLAHGSAAIGGFGGVAIEWSRSRQAPVDLRNFRNAYTRRLLQIGGGNHHPALLQPPARAPDHKNRHHKRAQILTPSPAPSPSPLITPPKASPSPSPSSFHPFLAPPHLVRPLPSTPQAKRDPEVGAPHSLHKHSWRNYVLVTAGSTVFLVMTATFVIYCGVKKVGTVKPWVTGLSGQLQRAFVTDVHFSYPLRSDVEILNGLDLTIGCGKVTALVGSSGAGKSTVVQLLARYYEPTQGRITVAGEDIRIFDKREWSRVVSLVNQDPVLFSASVGENIAYGLPDDVISKDEIIKAAKAANAHEFIISLPQGYDTLVGERGSLLSGGQRQRIAIARAFLKNAPVLILDEATSALDTTSERLVQEALDLLMKGRTSLVIAHRLSTAQNAHQIAVCSDGKIMELGTHAELVAKGGSYASLVGTQRLAFESCKHLLLHTRR